MTTLAEPGPRERVATTRVLQLATMAQKHALRDLYQDLIRDGFGDVCRCVDHIGSLRFPDWDTYKRAV